VESSTRVGIDVGGTFTDVFLFDEKTASLHVYKLPTSADDQSIAIVEGLERILSANGYTVADVAFFAHGTTVATNALLEHRGARVALITTSGFRDLLEIGRQNRPHLYDLQADKPVPLVTRDLRFEVDERLAHDGSILIDLDADELRRVVERMAMVEVEAVAVCFLHSYSNPRHEQLAEEEVRKAFPDKFVTASHQVLAEYREFERLNTTVVNAFLGPSTSRYVRGLASRLADVGLQATPHMTQSNGGVVTLETAAKSPFKIALSGPSAGVMGARYLGDVAGIKDIITFDMGGTSTDVSLIKNGVATVGQERVIGGYPVRSQAVDIHTVGAGGGSTAWVDSGGLLKVGPQSAGAFPGPVCYGRGGDQPTVTDANVVLGILNPTALLGGRMPIDASLAWHALRSLGDRIGKDAAETAEGILRVTTAHLQGAIRVISVQRGHDPRDYVLVPFGGAGPLHSGRLMRELSIPSGLIPEHPGLLCAFGLLTTDVTLDQSVTRVVPATVELAVIEKIFDSLERQASQSLAMEGADARASTLERSIDMRYRGQNYELSVPVAPGSVTKKLITRAIADFGEVHRATYGYVAEGEEVVFVTFRVRAVGNAPSIELRRFDSAPERLPSAAALVGTRDVYLEGRFGRVPVYDRTSLSTGEVVEGPAIIEQLDSTTLILGGQRAVVDEFRNLRIADESVQEPGSNAEAAVSERAAKP